jgi:hypothetical protein
MGSPGREVHICRRGDDDVQVTPIGVHDAELVDMGLDVEAADQELAAIGESHWLEQFEPAAGTLDRVQAAATWACNMGAGDEERMAESNLHDQLGSSVAQPTGWPVRTSALGIGSEVSVSDRRWPPGTLACGMCVARVGAVPDSSGTPVLGPGSHSYTVVQRGTGRL